MSDQKDLILFSLDSLKFGIGSEYFVRATRAVEITPLPKSPASILGVINFHGKIIPVINIREKLNLPSKQLCISDQMIILKTSENFFVIVVDSILDFLNHQEIVLSKNISKEIDYVDGVIKVDGEIIPLTRIENLFMPEEMGELNFDNNIELSL